MGETATRTDDGLPKVYPSCRPHGTSTYFSGAGDDATNGVGAGNRLLFNLLNTDVNKTVDVTYNEDIYIKDGYMISRGAPFGASVDIEIVHPVSGVIACFGKHIPILGDGWFPLDTEDRSLVPAGLIVRVTVNNSDGAGGQDAAAAFVLAGRIEMFRTNSV